MFLVGAVLLFREGLSHHRASGEQYVERAGDVHGAKVILASFLVLFAASGAISQLLTLSLVAKYAAPASVFVGALTALVTVSGLAVVVGRGLLRVVSLHALHYAGAVVCLLLAGLTAYELLGGPGAPPAAGSSRQPGDVPGEHGVPDEGADVEQRVSDHQGVTRPQRL
ncbi:MAG: TMEM165/GDT1 family protein [Nocardioides sp.]